MHTFLALAPILTVFLLLVVPALRLVVLRRMKPNTRREGLGGKRA